MVYHSLQALLDLFIQALQIPGWLGAAAIGAVIAAISYVLKLILGWCFAEIDTKNKRLSQLVEWSAPLIVDSKLSNSI